LAVASDPSVGCRIAYPLIRDGPPDLPPGRIFLATAPAPVSINGVPRATEERTEIFPGTWQIGRRDADDSAVGRAAAREGCKANREGGSMSARKRTARRFLVEALEGRLAPGGLSGGVLRDGITRSSGEEIPQAHVAPLRAAGGGPVAGLVSAAAHKIDPA
jgi:hypothetical protein